MSSIVINNNCSEAAVSLDFGVQTNGQTTATIILNGGTPTTLPINVQLGIANFVINPNTIGSNLHGVIQIQSEINGFVAEAATVGSCQIDCCIAKLLESAINCTCHCDKCKEELDIAEKIFLLLQSSKYAAEAGNNYDDAVAKYNKANELCIETCACGC